VTSSQWRQNNLGKKGNMRDYADIAQLVCLSNLENLNALFIAEDMPQEQRLLRLNTIAIHQMTLLTQSESTKLLEDEK
jgi:hypothetical protein